MHIAVITETGALETRVAATPETVKKLIALGGSITIEAGAGLASGIPDSDYEAAGATIAKSAKEALKGAEVVLKVRRPSSAEIKLMPKGALVLAIMDPYDNTEALSAMAEAGLVSFAMELMPRITRAQVMDVLLKGMESPGSGKTLIEKIANSIDLQGSLLATKTIDEMHEIYQKQSSRSNLVAYFKNVNYRIDDYVVDSGMRLMQLLGEIVYSGDYITVHPELGIVRTGNDGLILDQHVGNRVGGSYDLKMYTSNPFVKVMPYLGK